MYYNYVITKIRHCEEAESRRGNLCGIFFNKIIIEPQRTQSFL